MAPDPALAQAEAARLLTEARAAKHAALVQRRVAKSKLRRLAELRRLCKEYQIVLDLGPDFDIDRMKT